MSNAIRESTVARRRGSSSSVFLNTGARGILIGVLQRQCSTLHHHRRRRVGRIGHHDRCLLTLVLVYSARRHGVCLGVYVYFSSVGAGTVWGGRLFSSFWDRIWAE